MGQPRYSNTSERSVSLLEGAYILGRYMQMPEGDQPTLKAWNDWKETWKNHPRMIDEAEALRHHAFRITQRF